MSINMGNAPLYHQLKEDMALRGLRPSTRLLRSEVITASPRIAEVLRLGLDRALIEPFEDIEDHPEAGAAAVRSSGVYDRDVVVGLAAGKIIPGRLRK